MRRRREVPPPEEWDGSEWVDVGPDGRWKPSAAERFRALVVLGVVFGVLAVLVALASVDDGDEDDDVATATTTSSTIVPATASTTTEVVDPTSVGGEAPPEPCVFDDRRAAPLRTTAEVAVLVLNGTPRGGHAGATSDELDDLGYETLEPGNAGLVAVTRIDYEPGHCAEAFRLISDLGVDGAELYAAEPGSEAVTSRADVVVTLGRDSI